MQPWGEFLDVEWYGEEIVPADEIDPITFDPWRDSRRTVFLVPRALVLKVAQIERMSFCLRDQERVAQIRNELHATGLREPLELVVDLDGRIVLRDGHHRLLATEGIAHFDLLPIFITHSERIFVDGAVPIHAGMLTVLMSHGRQATWA